MTNPEEDDSSDGIPFGDFFARLLNYRRFILQMTAAATVLAALGAGLYYLWQPTLWTSSLEFSPIFTGANQGFYPNKLLYASNDIVDPTVLDQVYDKNKVQDYCGRDEFRSGFVVEENSVDLQFLDLDYQARLADTRISAVDRERLQSEYRARRLTLPLQYKLTWIRPTGCRSLPQVLASKALVEVLQTWANDADQKRGVLKLRVAILTPDLLDTGNLDASSLLIRADLVRSALTRVIANVRDVELLSGAELIRLGTKSDSFAQVRARLEDLVQVHLEPLMAAAGRGLGSDAISWVEQSLEEATVEQRSAEDRASAYQMALREYSGMTGSPPASAGGAQRPQNSSDVQALTPQIDRTFIDRIADLSAANTTFRQEVTRDMVKAKVAAVDTASKVEHYKALLARLKGAGSGALPPAEVNRKLDAIVVEGKDQIKRFDDLYDEFSRVSLRSGAMMYRIERPTVTQTLRAFSQRSVVLFILSVLFISPVVLAIGCLIHYAIRRAATSRARA